MCEDPFEEISTLQEVFSIDFMFMSCSTADVIWGHFCMIMWGAGHVRRSILRDQHFTRGHVI